MITRELAESIKKRREAGMADEQIHAILENSGYVEDEIIAAIEASYKDTSALPSEVDSHKAAPAETEKKKKGWWPF